MDTTAHASPFPPESSNLPPAPSGRSANGTATGFSPGSAAPLALAPEIKAAAEAQLAAALQYPDPLAKMVGILNAKMFENQCQQEELISRLPPCPAQEPGQGPAQALEAANRIREMENTQRGRREFGRMVQLEKQLRVVKS